MKKKEFVFVYGTLRRNESNHSLLRDALCLAEQAWTTGTIFDTKCGYPGLVNTDTGCVYGEIYEVDKEQLEKLDRLEGYYGEGQNNDYERIEKAVYTDHGTYMAYVYVMREWMPLPIPYDDWRVYHFLKQNTLPYFAYGSCMDVERFEIASVNHFFHQVVGRGILNGYSLRFTIQANDGGRADIVEIGGTVQGKLYQIPPQAIDYLNRREGVHLGMYRPSIVTIQLDNGIFMDALTYIVVDKGKETAPPDHYLQEIIRGGKGFLSSEYVEELHKHIKKLS